MKLIMPYGMIQIFGICPGIALLQNHVKAPIRCMCKDVSLWHCDFINENIKTT